MILEIENIPVYFPFDKIYPEQLKYIKSLMKSIQIPGHVLIEMPSGTGKTISLLSCTVSYLLHCKDNGKPFQIIYCSRTLPEIDKTLKELKTLINYIKKHRSFNFLGMGLSKRENLCINSQALSSFDLELTCRKMINHLDNLKCDFYESPSIPIPEGVYDFEDIKDFGIENNICPYFFVRKSLHLCDCLIYPYNYLIDPSVYSIVSKNLRENAVVIFDEAHNIDSHCIESLSIDINRTILESVTKILIKIENKIKDNQNEFAVLLKREYDICKKKKEFIYENTIPASLHSNKPEVLPGNLRNANHFLSVMKRFVEFLKTKLKTTHLTIESINSFLQSIKDLTLVDRKTLQFVSQRMGLMIQTLGVEDEEIYKLLMVANFGTLLGIYSKGFSVIFEPHDSMSGVFNPILKLSCNDASIAIEHVFKKFRNVVITSGTLSPIDMYPKLLNFNPVNVFEIGATLDRNSISPLIITKGNDQMLLKSENTDETNLIDHNSNKMTTSFKLRIEQSVVRNYGNLVISLSQIVPDNIVVFFPSYIYMEEIITLWSQTKIMDEIIENKLVFIETPDFRETELALRNYRLACDNGRGAILFSVARGKVSEGVDFEHGYGRAVVMLGIPFMYSESLKIKERLKYIKETHGIKEYDFLIFDAMRHCAQCLGRVLRNKNDYGLMIMADNRFMMSNRINKLPKWIQNYIEKGNMDLSVDMSISIAKSFYKIMAQPNFADGNSLLDHSEALKYLAKI